MFGGMIDCNASMPEDGNKIICLDPPLELPGGSRDPSSCLVFSFGINRDTSFDDEVSRLPCEVHMFDIKPVYPVYLMGLARHVHFHKTGLADHHFISYVQDVNKTVEFNDVGGFLRENELTGRPLHALKIDIEESEWDALKQLVKEPILDIVGQIVMEVHTIKVLELPPSEQLNFLQDRYHILREIEKRGFRAVSYWDNRQPKLVYKDPDGSTFDTCGEILYVNTNWYKDSFKKKLKDIGFQFRGV
ncbi:probable methyltransferase-like protein 24 [Penaeus chinensis]|uniref:probable methyltransferase-like protein 24 n=1 Tax=Penaeus chinensis TaxID=139456 RepID=UPI001FB7D96C|nr:probable methyltransferase-like protein 24 [Penaeus chinensis]